MSERYEVLHELFYQFKRADNAYSCYLKEKVYLYASIIRKANERICNLLEANISIFDEEQNAHAQELVFHYDVWMAQFDELKQQLNPSLSSIFVFERFPGSPPFPKKSKEAFIEAYKNLSI